MVLRCPDLLIFSSCAIGTKCCCDTTYSFKQISKLCFSLFCWNLCFKSLPSFLKAHFGMKLTKSFMIEAEPHTRCRLRLWRLIWLCWYFQNFKIANLSSTTVMLPRIPFTYSHWLESHRGSCVNTKIWRFLWCCIVIIHRFGLGVTNSKDRPLWAVHLADSREPSPPDLPPGPPLPSTAPGPVQDRPPLLPWLDWTQGLSLGSKHLVFPYYRDSSQSRFLLGKVSAPDIMLFCASVLSCPPLCGFRLPNTCQGWL